ncbi:cyclin-T1-3-like isoform X1 isoform A [Chlorella sorokiniana]|uniref:Cyclin-T1-3-like isoform X1 isoform A n=1 Tax=Chlorella sorokiniana TaxID=3076 RepID=A0A2P6TGS4_CHLSO|nr:cyclin-T1-3-like isoform X1 isoform A [Chlorella sorokiniana]|eukprot:PRW33321.1 cyclin-T1-3-like isoform X1 isoform A [Chlorella sorokiniana]
MEALPPSQRDGLRPEQVASIKGTAINTIIETGVVLSMDIVAISSAIVFLHRFYATKSIVRNDPFLFAVACLYLGGKVEDSPKSVRDVLMACCKHRFKESAHRLQHDREVYESLREKVFVAERALLYALDFQFATDLPHKPCFDMLASEPLRSHRERIHCTDPKRAHHLAQFPINFANDSLRTEACLHFTGKQIAAACIWLTLKLLKEDSNIYTDQGQLWWVAHGVQEEHLEGVEDMLQGLYRQNLWATYSNNDLVLQSVAALTPEQQAAKERERAVAAAAAATQQQQHGAAGGPPPPGQQQAAAGALPADIAAANRESWALAQKPGAAGVADTPAAAAAAAPPAAAAAGRAAAETAANATAADLPTRARAVRKGGRMRIRGVKGLAGAAADLELERYDPFAAGAKIVIQGEPNAPPKVRGPPATTFFRGKVAGSPDSQVLLNVDSQGNMHGSVENGKRRFRLRKRAPTPAGAGGRRLAQAGDASLVVTAADSTAFNRPGFTCGNNSTTGGCVPKPYNLTEAWTVPEADGRLTFLQSELQDVQEKQLDVSRYRINVAGVSDDYDPFASRRRKLQQQVPNYSVKDSAYQVTMAIETDIHFFMKFGDVDAALNHIAQVVGLADVVFSREIGADIMIGYVRLWTTPDPYNAKAYNDAWQPLQTFREYWNQNMQEVPRTLAFYMSGASLGLTGYAWVGALCSWADNPGSNIGYGICATHTHDSCGWEGVNAPIDQCSPSSVCPQPELRRLPTCSAPTPFFHGSGLGAGTIMSYMSGLGWNALNS